MVQRLKCLPAMRETWVRSLGQEDHLEKEMATQRSLVGYSTWGRKESDTTERLHCTSLYKTKNNARMYAMAT